VDPETQIATYCVTSNMRYEQLALVTI
jgi:hypothetical protein